jgi:hypothetical protein
MRRAEKLVKRKREFQRRGASETKPKQNQPTPPLEFSSSTIPESIGNMLNKRIARNFKIQNS